MKQFLSILVSILLFTFYCLLFTSSCYAIPAFPGAEGFGSETIGGRGGRVIEVTNLNDSGPGSLRACVEASGPRICVFRTGGTIELQSRLNITNPFITIAGQTAPGGGICLKKPFSIKSEFIIQSHDVIIRYLRFRPGSGEHHDAIGIHYNNAHDIIIDHCSMSWAVDENLSSWYDPHDFTIQWSIISEGLNCNTHEKGCHSKGALLGAEGSRDISFHHNLLAHNVERSPRIKTSGVVDIVNNVIFNSGGSTITDDYTKVPVNYIGNLYIPPVSRENGIYVNTSNAGGYGFEIYLEGNITRERYNNSLAENLAISTSDRVWLVPNRHSAPEVTTYICNSIDDCEVKNQVLANAGAILPARDVVDQRIVNDVINGTGRIIDDPSEVGGWPILASGTPPQDADHDGMPDEWENIHFSNLDRGSADDSSSDYDNDGYTDLEEFLNGTNPKDGSPSSPSPSPFPSSSPSPACQADINKDSIVNINDIRQVLGQYGNSCSGCSEDINQDGVVNIIDVTFILKYWGMSCD